MLKNDNKQLGVSTYLNRYKFGIFLYVLVYVVAAAMSIVITLLSARAIELVTLKQYMLAINTFVITIMCLVVRRICWFSSGLIYQKYATSIMAELNLDLAKQAFKLNSQTYDRSRF